MRLGGAVVIAAGVTLAQVPMEVPVAVVSVSREALEATGRTDFSKLALLVAADPPPAGKGKPLGDQVRVELSDGIRGTASVLPEGWSARMDGRTLIAQGPPVESISIRYDVGRDLEKLIGKSCRFRISLNGREVFNQQFTVNYKVNPPVGSINFPPIVTYGRPFWGSRDGSLAPIQRFDFDRRGERVSFSRNSFNHWDDHEFISDFSPLTDRILPPQPPTVDVMSGFTLIGRDRFNDKLAETYLNLIMKPPQQCAPGITGGDRLAFAGQNACVTGCFDGLEGDAKRLAAILDGQTELQPKAGSPNVFVFRIPPNTTPGEHTIEFKGIAAGTHKIGVLAVDGSIDQNELLKGSSTTMRLRVLGSEERLPLQIINGTPSTILIEGGVSQDVSSPGGPNNLVTRSVTGIRKGDFNIQYKLATPACGIVPAK